MCELGVHSVVDRFKIHDRYPDQILCERLNYYVVLGQHRYERRTILAYMKTTRKKCWPVE